MKTTTAPHWVALNVRWMIARDLDRVMAIERESFEFPWSRKQLVGCLRQRNVVGKVAEFDDRVVGYMIYELKRGRITVLNLAVDPAERRRGIARRMVGKLAAMLKAGYRNRITLIVRETNLAGQLFFRACGFRAVTVLRRFYDDTPEDAYGMAYWIPSNENG